jgi:hypothetical protein
VRKSYLEILTSAIWMLRNAPRGPFPGDPSVQCPENFSPVKIFTSPRFFFTWLRKFLPGSSWEALFASCAMLPGDQAPVQRPSTVTHSCVTRLPQMLQNFLPGLMGAILVFIFCFLLFLSFSTPRAFPTPHLHATNIIGKSLLSSS